MPIASDDSIGTGAPHLGRNKPIFSFEAVSRQDTCGGRSDVWSETPSMPDLRGLSGDTPSSERPHTLGGRRAADLRDSDDENLAQLRIATHVERPRFNTRQEQGPLDK